MAVKSWVGLSSSAASPWSQAASRRVISYAPVAFIEIPVIGIGPICRFRVLRESNPSQFNMTDGEFRGIWA